MLIKSREWEKGYNTITSIDEKKNNTLMDFGVLVLNEGTVEIDKMNMERAFLLVHGEVRFEWGNNAEVLKRESFLNENPGCLHVPKGVDVKITGIGKSSEICVIRTFNDLVFPPKLYCREECMSEARGKGTMKETSTRIVRTVFDKSNSPLSNLVLGEVIDYPGKWSSYPPHHHLQPEIYFYKFFPENGYGFAQLGEDVVKVHSNDTLKILNDVSHPQVTAPGYTMYYLWVIRHLDGNPYIKPVFEPEHVWVAEAGAKIWPDI